MGVVIGLSPPQQGRADGVDRAALPGVEAMAIDAGRDVRVGVAEHGRHVDDLLAHGEHHAAGRMPQAVQAHSWYAGPRARAVQGAQQVAVVDRRAALGHELQWRQFSNRAYCTTATSGTVLSQQWHYGCCAHSDPGARYKRSLRV